MSLERCRELILAAQAHATQVEKNFHLESEFVFPLPSPIEGKKLPVPEVAGIFKGSMSAAERRAALKDFAIGDVIASPGHRILRAPENIPQLAVRFQERDEAVGHDRAVINVVTDLIGNVAEIDAWDGHHRFLGYLYAGKRKLSEMPNDAYDILINGVDAAGNTREHLQPVSGIDFSRWKSWDGTIPLRRNGKIVDVIAPGDLRNTELGSAHTLAETLLSNLAKGAPRVAMAFSSGTRLPTNETMLEAIHQGFGELVLIPESLDHLSDLEARVLEYNAATSVPGTSPNPPRIHLNIYRGPAPEYLDAFGMSSLMSRIQQAYGAYRGPDLIRWRPDPDDLKLYRALSPERKKAITLKWFDEDLALSRTVATGTSVKKFEKSPEELKVLAAANAHRALDLLLATAKIQNLTEEQLVRFLEETPLIYNDGIESTTSDAARAVGGGGYRTFTYYPGDNGLSGPALQAHLAKRLREFARKLIHDWSAPDADAIKIAAWAHDTLANEIKPFHDGTGRASRAIADLVLLRFDFPLPRYPSTHAFGAGGLIETYFGTIKNGYFSRFLADAERASFESIPAAPTP